jgi:hypothetical protein
MIVVLWRRERDERFDDITILVLSSAKFCANQIDLTEF